MQLRVHHILCAPLFIGKGYSREFVKNMTKIVSEIEKNATIRLQTAPDVICSACPNLKDGQCSLDCNHVVSKDEELLGRLELNVTENKSAKELFSEIAGKMTEEIFEESCHNCSWYQQGLCNYTLYKKNLNRFI